MEDRKVQLSSMKVKKDLIYPIAKKLGIKYLTWMNKNEIIDEIIGNGSLSRSPRKYMCEQKYKCVLCDGRHICEHKKQRPACKECRLMTTMHF